ncbi:MAG: hypothetical protein AAB263_13145 [Planctomycetota bacterium]
MNDKTTAQEIAPLNYGQRKEYIAKALGVEWIDGSAIVALEEEYGYRTWFWFSNISTEELERFWVNLKSVGPYFGDPSSPDTGSVPLPGVLVQNIGSDQHKELWSYFYHLSDFRGHIHEDDDSHLIKNTYVYHAGYDAVAVQLGDGLKPA